MSFACDVFRLSYMYIVMLFEKWSNGCTFYCGYGWLHMYADVHRCTCI